MYLIFTDSASNLSERIIKKYNINVVSFTFSVEGEEFMCYEKQKKFDYAGFYAMLRSKQHVRTSMVNEQAFYDAFLPAASSGKPVLYVGMSSTLSGTYAAGVRALEELKEKFPAFEYEAVDTLSGSYGEGLLCYYAARMREEEVSLAHTAVRLRSLVPHLRSRFTCDDLFYLKRGGRVSGAVALAGTLMGIKPVLKADENGKIVMYAKVRGRKNAIDKLVDELERSVDMTKRQIISIAHADCAEDAKYLESRLKKLPFISDILFEIMEPVTGTHGGPGMLALFYIAKQK